MSTTATRVSPERPYTWLPVKMFNYFADRFPIDVTPLGTIDEAHAEASRQTGLSDFGDSAYREGMERFHTSLAVDADLTPAGRRFARGALVDALINRLRIQQQLAAEPRITERPLGPALVILGLPRSGTTLLQILLALDPANRSLRGWEGHRPAPSPVVGAESHDPRVAAAERATWLLDRIAPAVRVLHPTGPRLPTECVRLFANSFASLELGAIYQVPSYTTWLLATDMAAHYAYYATQLQVLGWHDHRARWTLKSPAHLFWVDALAEALPAARLVLLHRDPAEVIGSYCSLVSVLAAANARHVDRVGIGAYWSAAWAEGVRRAEAARAALPTDRIYDLRYRDLVGDPVAAIAAVYSAHDLTFSDEFELAIKQYLASDPQRKGTAHRYVLGDFGLTEDGVRRQFAEVGPERWR